MLNHMDMALGTLLEMDLTKRIEAVELEALMEEMMERMLDVLLASLMVKVLVTLMDAMTVLRYAPFVLARELEQVMVGMLGALF